MDIENDYLGFNSTIEQEKFFKCDICVLTFRTPSERDEHILNHLQKMTCSVCHETIIQLGSIWYSPHEHTNHNLIKNETDLVEEIECPTASIEYTNTHRNDNNDMEFEHDNLITFEPEFDTFSDQIEQKAIDIVNIIPSDDVVAKNECDMSDETFENVSKLNKRRKLHTITSIVSKASLSVKITWQCISCKEIFVTKRNLIRHQRTSCGSFKKRPYQCLMCDKTWKSKRALREHERRHIVEPSIEMKAQSPNGEDETEKRRKSVHGSRSIECTECGNTFANKRNLAKHNLYSHGKGENSDKFSMDDVGITAIAIDKQINITADQLFNSLSCPICKKEYENNVLVRSHLRVHEIRFTCKICRSGFPKFRNCLSHISSTHSNRGDLSVSLRNYEDSLQTHSTNDLIDWVCKYCCKVFETEKNLAKHILKDHSDDKEEHACIICDSKISKLDELLTHMKAHPECTQHKCDFDGCGQTFPYKSFQLTHLGKHKQNNMPIIRRTQNDVSEFSRQQAMLSIKGKCDDNSIIEKTLTCSFCSKIFPNLTAVRYHVETIHMKSNERIKCTVAECNKVYKSASGLKNHIKNDHPHAVKQCEKCPKVFYLEDEFNKHRLKHDQNEGTLVCSICDKTFKMKHALRVHLSTHEKEVPCSVCDEKFASVESMVEHRKRHGKEKIIQCKFPGCNEVFENRRMHMLHAVQHPEDKKKRCICSICGKKLSKGGLAGHMNAHNGTRPFVCKVCGKSFTKDSSLRRHNMIHTGEKPYVCDIDGCSQAYRDSIDLKRHKFSVHKIYTKKHTCSICSKVFPENKLLTKHINTVHGCSNLE